MKDRTKLKNRTKRSFTLLEVMLTLMIMAIVAGVVGFQLKGMMDTHRFECHAKKLKEQMERAQLLALLYNTDIKVTIAKDKNVWSVTTHSDEAALKHLNKTRVKLEGVSSIFFRGHRHKQSLIIAVLSNGRFEPSGTLEIKGNDKVRYIDFQVPIQINYTKKYTRPSQMSLPPKPTKES